MLLYKMFRISKQVNHQQSLAIAELNYKSVVDKLQKRKKIILSWLKNKTCCVNCESI